MGEVSDETLMAFADEELSPAERAHVAAVLAADPELRARLEIFETMGRRLSAAFSDRLNEPVPQHLVDLVMSQGLDDGARRTVAAPELRPASAASSIWSTIVRVLSFEIPVWQTALATSAVVLVGIGAASKLSGSAPRIAEPAADQKLPVLALDNGHLVAAGRLAQILETLPGYIVHQMDDAAADRPAATASIRLTFKSQDGYCRQFEIAGIGGVRASEIACRSASGSWRVVAHAPGGVSKPINPSAKPAGEQGASMDATIERLKIGDALGREEETDAISRRWKP